METRGPVRRAAIYVCICYSNSDFLPRWTCRTECSMLKSCVLANAVTPFSVLVKLLIKERVNWREIVNEQITDYVYIVLDFPMA